jgi:hypothetical protein
MARRLGGGGRQERTDSPAVSGGVHPKERNSVEHPEPRSGPGCTPSRRGYRAVTPPVTSEPRQIPPRTRSAATTGGQPQADRQGRPARPGQVSVIVPVGRRDGSTGSAGAQRKESAIRPRRPETQSARPSNFLFRTLASDRTPWGQMAQKRRIGTVFGTLDADHRPANLTAKEQESQPQHRKTKP